MEAFWPRRVLCTSTDRVRERSLTFCIEHGRIYIDLPCLESTDPDSLSAREEGTERDEAAGALEQEHLCRL